MQCSFPYPHQHISITSIVLIKVFMSISFSLMQCSFPYGSTIAYFAAVQPRFKLGRTIYGQSIFISTVRLLNGNPVEKHIQYRFFDYVFITFHSIGYQIILLCRSTRSVSSFRNDHSRILFIVKSKHLLDCLKQMQFKDQDVLSNKVNLDY